MKNLIVTSILLATVAAGASEDWVVLTPQQKQIISQDNCAAAAVDAAASLISEEIQDAGVDFPDHIYLRNLHVSTPKKLYAVDFPGGSTILVSTRVHGSKCAVTDASRVVPQFL